MTREEAIAILRSLKDRNVKCLELIRRYPYPNRLMLTTQAIYMAIEALKGADGDLFAETPTVSEKHQLSEETPTNAPTDLISRQAALDAIMGEPTDAHYPSWYAQKIKLLPSAEAVQGEECDHCVYKWGMKGGETDGDLISRQDAIDAVARAIWHYPNECYKNLNVYEVAEALVGDAIKSLPSAEPKIGEWVFNVDNESISELWNCSECGQWSFAKTNYCPNCGARMLGKEDEDE